MTTEMYCAGEPTVEKRDVFIDALGKAHSSRDKALDANVFYDVLAEIRTALVGSIIDDPDRRDYAARQIMGAMKRNPKMFAALIGYADAT